MPTTPLPCPALMRAMDDLRDTPGADAVASLARIVDAIRPADPGNQRLAEDRLRALVHRLDTDPATRAALRRAVMALLATCRQVSFYADAGILPNTGFFSELWRRIVQRAFPALPDHAHLKDCLTSLFHRVTDHRWLDALPRELKVDFWRALRIHEDLEADATARAFAEMLDAADVLAIRIGAMGLEPELLRLHPRLEQLESPFMALVGEAQRLSAAYRAYLAGGTAPAEDEGHLAVLIGQCREVLARVRARAAAVGTSLTLTYLLKRLAQSLDRLELVVKMLATRHQDGSAAEEATLWIDYLSEAVGAEAQRQGIRSHIGDTLSLLALRVTDNARRAGEHYITTTREEYFQMWRGAMGAGVVVGFMALLKVWSSQAALAPLGYTLAYAANYALGFVLIHLLHFTLATKQPAMTASTIAGVISESKGRFKDVEKLATLVVDVIRSQLAAILGNVLLAIPTAIVIGVVIATFTGTPLMDPAKAHKLMAELSPFESLALPHAAIAGVCLFLAGLLSGYYDNLAAYERIRERIEHARWLGRLLGEARRARLAAYLDDNLGALAGNAALGVMLALVGFVGFLTGLPVDVRHVTLSSANFGLALASLDFNVPPLVIAKVLAGIALVGATNLAVSFTLALWLALRSRGVRLTETGILTRRVLSHLRTEGRRFFWP